ncbi:aminoimidazole riboside kinase [Pseudescherichia sp.]|uniref:aminoimidazole riboside kinase n=1 Tax=Pseudescherichia sp. TaxID=2055881 RepID=UPI0028969F6E|nr:aminoimidazole riboside kinase [Pseudescherichia sp.]
MKIWALGDAVIDLLPQGEMQYTACAGGAPVNVVVGAARLGCECGFIGRTGDDPFGHFLRDTLAEQGVNTQHMQFDPYHRTSTVLVSLGDEGDRSFTFLVDRSADQFLTADNLPAFGSDILHFCSLALVATPCRETLVRAISYIKQRDGLLSFDINLRPQMWPDAQEMLDTVRHFAQQADILKLSQEELYWLAGTTQHEKALGILRGYPSRLKVVTCGSDGAIVLWQDRLVQVSAFRVESLDTTGAGDAFMAGLLASLAQGNALQDGGQLKQAITQASACGALATTAKGALAALPDAQGMVAFMEAAPWLRFEIE